MTGEIPVIIQPRLDIRINGLDGKVHVPDATSVPVTNVDQAWQVMAQGKANRATSSTSCNADSSRSHFLVIVTVLSHNSLTGISSCGKLTLVDLAG